MKSFSQLLSPISEETFYSELFGHRAVHIPGRDDKFAGVFSWEDFRRLLNMTGIWTAASLKLKLDRQDVPPPLYCQRTIDRNQATVWQPDPLRVMEFAGRGASLICNQVETLHPGILAVLRLLEAALGGRASCNIYCSWPGHQAFDSHYDKHEVFALAIAGEKTWRLYEGRVDNPIHHAMFPTETQAQLDAKKGKVVQQLTLGPGDLLYIPRGQFHDALATDTACLHLSFAVALPNGLNVLTDAWERAAQDALFRANLPLAGSRSSDAALAAHLNRLRDRFIDLISAESFVERVKALQRSYPVQRPEYRLPDPSARIEAAAPARASSEPFAPGRTTSTAPRKRH